MVVYFMVIYDMVISIYAKKMQYIYIIIHTHTGKTTHPQFSGHDGKKRNVQLLLVLFVYPTKWSKRKNIAVLLVAKPHFFDKSKPKWPKKKRGQGRLTKINNGIVVIYIYIYNNYRYICLSNNFEHIIYIDCMGVFV